MTDDAFSAFGEAAAAHKLPAIMVSGRLPVFESVIEPTVDDIVAKVRPADTDRLIEIGCGLGFLLRPLARLVREAVGIDHSAIIAEFAASNPPANVTLLSGRFPDVQPPGSFDVILVYSVMHYLSGIETGRAFIDGCVRLLSPGGRLLLADLPNHDRWQRYHASTEGTEHLEAVERRKKAAREQFPEGYEVYSKFTATRFIDDAFILGVLSDLRRAGHEAYLLPQPSILPNSQTREDILVQRRA